MLDDIVLKIGRTHEVVTLNKDDSGDYIRFTIQEPDGVVKSLVGWAGKVIAFSSETGSTYMVSGAITLHTGTAATAGVSGHCTYTVSGADTDTGGRFPARMILTSGSVQSSISGWEIHITPYATATTTEYCTVNDVLGDNNAYSLLRLQDYAPEDVRKKIRVASAQIDKKIGTQSASDEAIGQLCKYMVLSDIASGLPTAEADGEKRMSLLGVVAKWDRYIAETLADYGYGAAEPLFTSP